MARGRVEAWTENQCHLFFAGGCRPNPGQASIGFVIHDEERRQVASVSTLINPYGLTSNAAHYKALIAGLRHALDLGITDIVAYGHLKLVVNQVNGDEACDNNRMKRYRKKVRNLMGRFEGFQVEHIYREENSTARSLAQACFLIASED